MLDKLKHGKDKNTNIIVDFLLKQALNDTQLRKGIEDESKTLTKMMEYIKGEAKKEAKKGVAMIPKEEVFSLAIHYFTEKIEKKPTVKKEEKYEQQSLFGDL